MPNHWTSNYWYLLHTLGYTYRAKKANKYIEFIKLAKEVLPCPKCRTHFIGYYSNNHLRLDKVNKNILIKWLIDYHNDVSIITHSKTYNEDAVYNFYHNNDVLVRNDEKVCELVIQLEKHIRDTKGSYKAFNRFLQILKKIYPFKDVRKALTKIPDNSLNAKKVCKIIKKNMPVTTSE